ncbi:MAG TPA: substrate-binding domain-containing protein [Candidatus Koribacter sp.]|jgi:ABC-type phosphate transport system substrate-binding protein
MHRSRFLTWVVFFALAAALPAAAKDLAVVVNKANETKTISAAELTKLLKNGTKKWNNGQDIIIVMRDPNAPEMRVLLQKVYGVSPEQLKSLVASANQGRSTPAFVIADSDEVILKMVSSTAGAVGICDVYTINSSVSVLKVDGKMPLEPGYLLHGVW